MSLKSIAKLDKTEAEQIISHFAEASSASRSVKGDFYLIDLVGVMGIAIQMGAQKQYIINRFLNVLSSDFYHKNGNETTTNKLIRELIHELKLDKGRFISHFNHPTRYLGSYNTTCNIPREAFNTDQLVLNGEMMKKYAFLVLNKMGHVEDHYFEELVKGGILDIIQLAVDYIRGRLTSIEENMNHSPKERYCFLWIKRSSSAHSYKAIPKVALLGFEYLALNTSCLAHTHMVRERFFQWVLDVGPQKVMKSLHRGIDLSATPFD